MSDLTKRQYGGNLAGLQADTQRALARLRADVDASANYTPADTSQWADPPPTTLGEAIDRIVTWLAARHSGDMPIG